MKNPVKRLFLAVSMMAAAVGAHAQKNFKPGYIVQPGGDTLRGELDARGGVRMSHLCLFRTSAAPEPVRYAPADLKAYGFASGARYESCQLPATAGAAGPAPVLFLQVLAQGKAMLYTLTDEENRMRYFFKQTGGDVVELIQTTQNIRPNNMLVQERLFPFRQVLSSAFIDCPAVQPMLVKAELRDSQLTSIFNRYNACGNGQVSPAKSFARVSKARFGLIVGAQRASATLDDGGEVALKSGLHPVYGAGLLINPGSFNEKLALRLELLYQTQVLEAKYVRMNQIAASLSSERNADITLKTLRAPLMLRYTVLLGPVRPYLQAGAMVSVLLDKHKSLILVTDQVLGGVGTTTNAREIEMRGLGFGPTGALGLLIPAGKSSVQIEARYDQLDSASRVFKLLGGPQTTSFLLGYNF